MRILFAFAGGQGHFDPLVPLARAAAAAGHDVAVAGRADMLEAIRERGFEAILSPGTAPDPAARMPLKPYDPVDEDRALREWYAGTLARDRAAALIGIARDLRADRIVHDEADFGAAVAAERLGVGSASVLVILAASFVRPDVVAEPLAALRAAHGLTAAAAPGAGHGAPGALVLSPFPPSLRAVPGAIAFRSGDPPAADGDAVYLTLGTVFNAESGDLFTRALAGVRELGVPVVATTGRQVDPAELGPQPPHVRIQRWIPQSELLPWCHAVVSQGGSGIAMGALAHGLPSVLLPVGADQPHTAAVLESLGAAVVLNPLTATPVDVAAAVRRVLDEPAFGVAARRVRKELLALRSASEAVAALANGNGAG
ncbi:MAG TPA: glycosyltransferase [Solirubrobacteraceae bacterium]|nr:glycosyltransferase [Solirubrobacteraceae bacterium]